MAVVNEMVAKLSTNSGWVVGSTTGDVTLWAAFDPGNPGDTITVYEFSGRGPEETLSSTAPGYEDFRIQFVSRSSSYESARTNAETAQRTVWNIINETISSTVGTPSTAFYLRIRPLQAPFLIGRDDAQRDLVAANYAVHRRST